MKTILVTNLGSTSTKAAVFHDDVSVFEATLRHPSQELSQFASILDQKAYRKAALENWMQSIGVSFESLDIICVRGGVIKPCVGGVYRVDQHVIDDILSGQYGMHVTNVGNLIGYEWGQTYGKEVVFVDAPISDEFHDLARYSGHAYVPRRSVYHALNQKQQARRFAQSVGKPLESLNLIVVHMGGGISVGVHHQGRVIDVTNALDGEGAMSPERAGSLSSIAVLNLMQRFNGDVAQVKKQLVGLGGLMSYVQTSDLREVVEMAKTSASHAQLIEAMIYQVAKDIGAMATVVFGKVDHIILTGGIAYNTQLMETLISRIAFIAPVTVYPGEDELYALACGALRYLKGEEGLQSYL